MADVLRLIDEGGDEWDAIVNDACDRLGNDIDQRCRDTMLLSPNVATRMWFLGMLLYMYDVRVDDGGDVRVKYYLDHIYEFMVFTAFQWGDVYRNMLSLRLQMDDDTYHELGCLCCVVDGGDADLGRRSAAGARVDGDKDGVA